MTIYIYNIAYLKCGELLASAKREDYLKGNLEDKFDSLQYLHHRSHHCDKQLINYQPFVEISGSFCRAINASQSELAWELIKGLSVKNQNMFIYCHNTFSEDINRCQASWLQHKLGVKPKYTFTIPYQGFLNLPLALREAAEYCSVHNNEKVSGIIVSAEKLLAPYRRDMHPFGWISDASAAMQFSTELPEVGYAYEFEKIDINWPLEHKEDSLKTLLSSVETLLSENNFKGDIIYPSFYKKILEGLCEIASGCSWMNGDHGMSFGLDSLARLSDSETFTGNVAIIFPETAGRVAGLFLKRVQ